MELIISEIQDALRVEHVDTDTETDGQTDGQTDKRLQPMCKVRMAAVTGPSLETR